MSILDIAKRLKIPDMDRLVNPYLEETISLRRIYLIIGLLVAVNLVNLTSKNPVILKEAVSVLPFLYMVLAVGIIWAYLIRYTKLKDNPWVNAIGSGMDFIGIMLLMSHAWNLMLILVPFMIFSVISAGARYADKYFYLAIAISVFVVFSGAPDGYWKTRPVFVVFGIFLLIGLPLAMHRLIKTLRVISEYAVSANETQMRFLNTASHELRTPLNSVITGSTLLYDAPLSAEQRMIVKLIEENGKNLLDMVNNILDHAALSNFSEPLKISAFKISDVLDDVKSSCRLMALEKNISLIFIPMSNNDVVFSDRGRVYLVLNNLVNNAIKYSANGSSVKVIVKRLDRDNVQFFVEDNGVGIKDSDKGVIFDMFKRVGNAQHIQGSGLGLNLVKLNNESLNGSINVYDNIGSGTVFAWTVPMKEGVIAAKTTTLNLEQLYEKHRNMVKPLRCLIIDDNPSNCMLLNALLHKSGHDSSYALSGEEGLEILKSKPFDLLILDINLGSMSGWDVIEAMDAMAVNVKPKIIISSAAVSSDNRNKAIMSGAVAFIGKPINVYELIGHIETSFVTSTPQSLGVSNSEQSPLSVMRSSGNNALYLEYLEGLKTDLSAEISYYSKVDFYNLAEIASHLHFLKNILNSLDLFQAANDVQIIGNRVTHGALLGSEDMERVLFICRQAMSHCKALIAEAVPTR